MGSVRAVLHHCELYPGICLKTEEKARRTLVRLASCFWIDRLFAHNIREEVNALFVKFLLRGS